MQPLLPYLRLLAHLLFATLVTWWFLFTGYSLVLLVQAGPAAVTAWYRHIGSRQFPSAPAALSDFLLQAAVALAMTVGLGIWLFQRNCGNRVKPPQKNPK